MNNNKKIKDEALLKTYEITLTHEELFFIITFLSYKCPLTFQNVFIAKSIIDFLLPYSQKLKPDEECKVILSKLYWIFFTDRLLSSTSLSPDEAAVIMSVHGKVMQAYNSLTPDEFEDTLEPNQAPAASARERERIVN